MMSDLTAEVHDEAAEAAAPVAAAVAEAVAENAVEEAVADAIEPVVAIVAELAEEVSEQANEIADREEIQWLRNELQGMEDRIVTRVAATLAVPALNSPSEEAAAEMMEAEAAVLEAQAVAAEEAPTSEQVVEEAQLDPLADVPPPGQNVAGRRRVRGLRRR